MFRDAQAQNDSPAVFTVSLNISLQNSRAGGHIDNEKIRM